MALANQYQSIDAISNFKSDDITVNQGDGKRDVAVDCALQPNDSMEKALHDCRRKLRKGLTDNEKL